MSRSATGLELTTVDGTLGTGIANDGSERRGFYLAVDDPRAVGRALHWATNNDLSAIVVLAERHAGDLARRAGLLAERDDAPTLEVWQVSGAEASEATPAPISKPPPIPADQWALAGVISEAGARAVDDYGLLIGDVAGLEVCRVVDGAGGPTIDVGVGQADRELHQLVHGKADLDDELRRVISAVAQYRRPGSHHPLTRVGRERWLRSALVDEPGLVGAERLEPIVPLRGRRGLKITEPAAAAGHDLDGRPIVVITMSGVDLDLIPDAADYRQRHDPAASVVIAVSERDLALSTVILDRLENATAVAVPSPWEPV
ncbi:MAG: hypothetical protein ACR2QO_04965 [Acidimicrobiales bacterium]